MRPVHRVGGPSCLKVLEEVHEELRRADHTTILGRQGGHAEQMEEVDEVDSLGLVVHEQGRRAEEGMSVRFGEDSGLEAPL